MLIPMAVLVLGMLGTGWGDGSRPGRRRRRTGGSTEATTLETAPAFLREAWNREVGAIRADLDEVSARLVALRAAILTVEITGTSAHLTFADGTVLLLRCRSTTGLRVLVDELDRGAPLKLGALHLTARPTAGIARFDRATGSTAVAFDAAAAVVRSEARRSQR